MFSLPLATPEPPYPPHRKPGRGDDAEQRVGYTLAPFAFFFATFALGLLLLLVIINQATEAAPMRR
jgi:hypothetical protein